MARTLKVDRSFLIALAILMAGGLVIFFSASFGLLATNQAEYSSIDFNQVVFGVLLGGIVCIITSRIPYKFWRQWAFWIFVATVVLNLAIFIPGLGFTHGGSERWLNLGSYSLQPGEFLRIAALFYYAALLAMFRNKTATLQYGLLPLVVMILGTELMFYVQGDTELVLPLALTAMYIGAGGRWRDLGILFLIGVIGVTGLIMTKPYIKQRVYIFMHPASDPLGSGYQIQQSLIAVGSGQITGRGFGQSLQKFNFLPEPVGDSIFAVAAEEFGFIGSMAILILYLLFGLFGLKIATRTSDPFGRLLTIGIVILIVVQSYMNVGAMLGVIPLTGVTLVFVSHGGTSMLVSLFAAGIILNISRQRA